MQRSRRQRRGIVLLVVLSLLVIFSLLVTTFVVVSGDYRTAAVMSARGQAKQTDPRQLLRDVLSSLLVDTNDHQSPLRGHGLLRDLYGDDGFVARVESVALLTDTTNGQFFELRLMDPPTGAPTFERDVPRDLSSRPYALRGTIGYYNGLVLTFVDGPGRGVSTRIIDYDPVGPAGNLGNVFRLTVIGATSARSPRTGDRVVVNGRPSSGTGFGYNPVAPAINGIHTLSAPDPGFDGSWGVPNFDDDGNGVIDDVGDAGFGDDLAAGAAALLPNRATHAESNAAFANYLRGGADERYDAADFQNVHLAALIPAYNQYQLINSATDLRRMNRNQVLPSFHRPALINWWFRNVIAPQVETPTGRIPSEELLLKVFLQPYGPDNIRASGDEPVQQPEFLDFVVNLKQMIIARPLPELNPYFWGGNAAFTANYLSAVASDPTLGRRNPYLMGPWDVDNDGDGERDGIWMDVGLPIEEDSQGRLFKGLVSVLCVDLDGRLNLNAQGSQGHFLTLQPSRVTHPTNLARRRATDPLPSTLVPGRGTGPADVNLRPLFNLLDPTDRFSVQFQWDNYWRLLNGAQPPGLSRPIPGRYGFDNLIGQFQSPGIAGLDFFSAVKHFEYPQNFFNIRTGLSSNLSAFQTPPDLFGELVVGLDHLGQAAYSRQAADPADALNFRFLNRDHPYEKNLLNPSAADSLYTLAELEGLLRFHDADMQPGGRPLSRRLAAMFENGPPLNNNLFTNSAFAPLARQSVTTHSVDLPVPNMLEPADLARIFPDSDRSGHSADDLLYLVFKPHASIAGGTIAAPGFSQSDDHRMHHVSEILRARLIQGFRWATHATPSVNVRRTWNQTSSPHDLRINQQIRGMLSPDLGMGLRMDINRPWGNGRDDNGNHVVDEHGFSFPALAPPTPGNNSLFRFTLEAGMAVDGWDNDSDGLVDEADPSEVELLWGGPWLTGFDHDNDGRVLADRNSDGVADLDNDAFLARQHFARHLYLLAMMLRDPEYSAREDVNGDGRIDNEFDMARSIAQWAVNVVDFRDADSIMTPFEYDRRPVTPSPGRDGVWGSAGDEDGVNGAEDIGEMLWPGSDDVPPWAVDGLLGPRNPGSDGVWGTPDDVTDAHLDDRDVVWGCERPELLITETLAFHDRRAQDLDDSGNGTVADPEGDAMMDPAAVENDFDQQLRPRGGLYVELYNPWTSNAERPPAEFYHTGTAAGWSAGVLLDKVSANGTDLGSPVWRMTVTTSDDDPRVFATPDPDHPSARVTTERVIYFTDTGSATRPSLSAPQDRVRPGSATRAFKHDTEVPTTVGIAPVLPGRYAVVGTYRTSTDVADPDTQSSDGQVNGFDNEFYARVGRQTTAATAEDTRRFVMRAHPDPNNNWFYVQNNPDASSLPSRYQPNVDPGTAPNDGVVDIMPPVVVPIPGLNISEGRIDWDPDESQATKYDYPVPYDESAGGYSVPYDLPFDVDPRLSLDPVPSESDPDELAKDVLTENGTYSAIRHVHLQRLANPLLPYHAIYNPYRTIDSMPVDLTVFNGREDDSMDQSVSAGSYTFDSRERGSGSKTPTMPHRNLMSNATVEPQPTPAGTVANHHFTHSLNHSLGYLNRTFGARFRRNFGAAGLPTNVPNGDMRYVGAPNTNDPAIDPGGGQPFPWLTWFNRPFTSQYDLMLVPEAPSARLFDKFSLADPDQVGDADPARSIYAGRSRPNFRNLENFFATTPPGESGVGSNLAAIFDFTHVPSKFLGTETWLDPRVFNNTANSATGWPARGTEFLHPPFNKISAYREPGKINLNTVYNHVVMDALRGGSLPGGVGPTFWQLVDSRRGFGERPVDASGLRSPVPPEKLDQTPPSNTWIPAGTIVPELRPVDAHGNTTPYYDPVVSDMPTIFANPFRGFGDNELVPPGATELTRWVRYQTEGTLLRSNRFDPVISFDPAVVFPIVPNAFKGPGDIDADLPLFNRPTGPPFGPAAATVGSAYPLPGRAHADPVRSPFFRNEPILRMPNMTTTRSNVYAIWITLGYFEVEQDAPRRFTPSQRADAGHVNRFGYRLGNEVGWDTGDIRRHRAFYVIDRSIPVAFEPGQMHNAENAILLQRFIE